MNPRFSTPTGLALVHQALVAAVIAAVGGCASSTTSGGAGAVDVASGPADTANGGAADAVADASPIDSAGAGPTFHKDVLPILQHKCQTCHSGTGIAPFALVTYADAKLRAESSLAAVNAGTMPPWGAQDTAECKPRFGWQHDLRVTDPEKQTLTAWIAAGKPEGNPADAPAVAKIPSLTLQNVQVSAKPAKPYVTSGNDDQMRCFTVDPQLTELKYLNGIQVLPGNPLVVHHVLVYADPNNASAKLANADGQYDCFGGPGYDEARLLDAWAPGAVPMEFPPNVGTPLQPGTRLVMQVHYHPAGTTADPDLTSVQMRFTAGVPEWIGASVLIGNFGKSGGDGTGLLPGENDPPAGPAFVIPANVKDHKESMRFVLPSSLEGQPMPKLHIYGAGTHMHYVGRDMKVWVERSFASAACTATQLDPVNSCTAKNCPGASGGDLVKCALDKCQKEAAALQGPCGDCVQAGIVGGGTASDVMAACQKPQEKPADVTDPASECLVQTPAWDFNWQRVYNYDTELEKLPIMRAGDTLYMRCTYDNTLGNTFVKDALASKGLSAPVQVKLGETTLDEMCLAVMQVVYKGK